MQGEANEPKNDLGHSNDYTKDEKVMNQIRERKRRLSVDGPRKGAHFKTIKLDLGAILRNIKVSTIDDNRFASLSIKLKNKLLPSPGKLR